MLTLDKTVYVTKFEKGYFAESQPYSHWSYTDDVLQAKQYRSEKLAKFRGNEAKKYIEAKTGLKDLSFFVEKWRVKIDTSLDGYTEYE